MAMEIIQRRRFLVTFLCTFGLIPLTGCGGQRHVPVSGSVTLDGLPLQNAILVFSPDTSKGNTARVSCTSPVQDGRFELHTAGVKRSEAGPGAPLGWYKVSLRGTMSGEMPTFPGQPEMQVNPVYLDAEKTPLSIEVVDNPEPGHYDIKLDK